MKNVTIRFAASSLVLGMTMISCSPGASVSRPASASSGVVQGEQAAADLHAKAREAISRRSLVEALNFAEKAVEASPREASHRMLLADLYLKNGRFTSAETSYRDVLTLNPGDPKASLNLALVEVALGKRDDAVRRIETLSADGQPGEIGLAFALAGQPERGIPLLEAAARSPDADGRIRQNLALAYALAGDWTKAEATASQDVSPIELPRRMRQFATFTNPAASWSQVAGLLNVTVVEDTGVPVRLALAPAPQLPAAIEPDVEAYAAAEPVPDPAPEPVVEAPVAVAAAPEPPSYAPLAAEPEAAKPSQPAYAAAVQALIDPKPAVARTASRVNISEPTFTPAPPRSAPRAPARIARGGRYVVQLGAFSSQASVERAWAGAYRRYGLAAHEPRSTTFNLSGRTLYRLSAAGFGTHGDAARVCRSIKARGGACFVRALAGDAPVRWASRYQRSA
jgi:Flp pilus assembly protein TadD/cell division septation protein DedD